MFWIYLEPIHSHAGISLNILKVQICLQIYPVYCVAYKDFLFLENRRFLCSRLLRILIHPLEGNGIRFYCDLMYCGSMSVMHLIVLSENRIH